MSNYGETRPGPSDGPPDEDFDDYGGDREPCWYCAGSGGWHDCGEDCCCCLCPDDNVICPECQGEGYL